MLWRKRPKEVATDPTALCNILMSAGAATADQIQRALDSKGDKLIGSLLVAMGIIRADQLEHALLLQQAARGKINARELAMAQLDRIGDLQDKITTGFKDLADAADSAKFAAIKRSK